MLQVCSIGCRDSGNRVKKEKRNSPSINISILTIEGFRTCLDEIEEKVRRIKAIQGYQKR